MVEKREGGMAGRPANQGVPFVCYVRVRNRTSRGLVEFDFSIGDPDLYVEMAMPEENFREFCLRYAVRYVTAEEAKRIEEDRSKWRYGDRENGTD